MNRSFPPLAFAAGLGVIAWIALGYLPGNPLAFVLVLVIAGFFLVGAFELHRFQQATQGLAGAVAATRGPPPALGPWLERLHPSLRHAVRLRVEGERVPLPGPALAPFLAGLLVLLGMLGTFLGMIVTLRGTGLALEHATDVEAIRASLAAPVKGLGLAFGTSVAGVAASASLGLMTALVRRERLRAARQLDACIGAALRPWSQVHRREESLRLLQAQAGVMAEVMPALVTQLQDLVSQVTRQGQALHEALLAGQDRFHGEAQRAYGGLAESVDRSLRASLSDSARLAGEAIAPAVQATLAGLARETATLHQALGQAVQQQLDGVSARLDHTGATLAERWQAALADQRVQAAALTEGLQAGLAQFAQTFEQRSATLLDDVAQRLDRSTAQQAQAWAQALAEQREDQARLARDHHALATATVSQVGQQAAALLHGLGEAQTAREAEARQREQDRLAAFHDGLAAMTATLQQDTRRTAELVGERQQQICATLEHTAQALTDQAGAQARATVAEIAQLVQAASAAPRAAAEVIGELRQALSDSLVRDNAALDERNRLLATLGGLLDAVNHASTEQRAAIDALVESTAAVLDRVATRFGDSAEAGARTLQTVAAQVSGSAAEVASLGEGFGVAVQLFSQASGQLTGQLQRIEEALGQSMARSDEQLAYYVAQAREIIDLTLGSQKQIVDDLQQLARAPTALAAGAE